VFCYSDPIAIGAMQIILAAGLRIPDDIAVIGCGNLHYDDFLQVPLSSVDQRSSSLGQTTAKLLLSLLTRKSDSKQRSRAVVVKSQLIVRQSTRRTR
jgi:LacI family transcriptional regulator